MRTKVPFTTRCLILVILIFAVSFSISWKLIRLHVVDQDERSRIAAEEMIDREIIPAQRGLIMDRNEEVLTNNIQSATIKANRYHLRELNVVVDGLAYNQAVNDPAWDAAPDDKARNKLYLKYRSRLLDNAVRDLDPSEKAELRRLHQADDPETLRRLSYSPEVLEQYYAAHDKLVAEVLYPFLSRAGQQEDDGQQDDEDAAEDPDEASGDDSSSRPQGRRGYLTREDIIERIAQPQTEAYNRIARAEGKPLKGFRNDIVLARHIPPETAAQLRSVLKKAHIRGIVIETELRRSYVMPEMLCHVLGYVNHENKGCSGVEATKDSYLAGVDGSCEYRHNPRGQVLPNEDDRYMPPKHGLNLRLTIDMRLQTILEQELDKGLRHFHAVRGCMIAVEPHTGDILAMVSRPSFDLNTKLVITHEGKFDRGTLKDSQGNTVTGDFNFACQARYEPGSTFKVITVGAALDQGVMGIRSSVNCNPFSVGYGSRPIHDVVNYGTRQVWEVLKKSSNPGAAQIALRVKWSRYKPYLEAYGLTKPVKIALPSGGPCLVADGSNIVNFSRISYGYSVSVSPLHMAMVYATIANGGVRMAPRLIDKIIAADGSIYDECPPVVERRVIKERVAKDLLMALESVTEKKPGDNGTATRAAIPGFRIGGKTGTAKKVKPRGGYYEGLYTVSFAGILPVDNPRVVIMTVIDEPHPTDCNPGGGTVAAPIFRAAAERIINVLNIPPSDPAAYEKYLEEKKQTAAAEAEAAAAASAPKKRRSARR